MRVWFSLKDREQACLAAASRVLCWVVGIVLGMLANSSAHSQFSLDRAFWHFFAAVITTVQLYRAPESPGI